jgi:Tfp pilus assembly protein PilX
LIPKSTNDMKMRVRNGDNGNTLLCALCTIIVISLIGANVLVNCTRHYNITAKQIKAWKEALYAAEAGGDVALDELRKNPSTPNFTADGWTIAPSPAPTPGPVAISDSTTVFRQP